MTYYEHHSDVLRVHHLSNIQPKDKFICNTFSICVNKSPTIYIYIVKNVPIGIKCHNMWTKYNVFLIKCHNMWTKYNVFLIICHNMWTKYNVFLIICHNMWTKYNVFLINCHNMWTKYNVFLIYMWTKYNVFLIYNPTFHAQFAPFKKEEIVRI
jgi:hypothetical protein